MNTKFAPRRAIWTIPRAQKLLSERTSRRSPSPPTLSSASLSFRVTHNTAVKMSPSNPIPMMVPLQPMMVAMYGERAEDEMSPTLPPMLRIPRAVPLSSGGNHPETSLTPGTKTPAPRSPATSLARATCQKPWAKPKRMVLTAIPRMLATITLLLPILSARAPHGTCPMA